MVSSQPQAHGAKRAWPGEGGPARRTSLPSLEIRKISVAGTQPRRKQTVVKEEKKTGRANSHKPLQATERNVQFT